MTGRSEFWVTCPACPHTWIAVRLPMEMAQAAKLMKEACCPKCGATKGLFVASQADIVAAGNAATEECPHGVRDLRACHTCTPRDSGFYVTGGA